uniref:C2H2-type domain-containing protein n=2 Tax=Clastoptera arizonana TaxID=38151 RepID=A0A1B6DET9_9HEMI
MILQTDTEEDSTIEEVTVDESPQIRLPVNFVNIEELNVESKNIIEKKSPQKISNKVQFSKIDRDFDVRPFRCKFSSCLYKFRSNESLSLHVACHNELNTKYYSCSYCEQVFNKWGPCALHLWNSHTIDVDLFTCYICSTYKTTTNKKLEDHLRIHRDVREFLCPICGKKFKQKTQMRNHQVSTHKDRNTNDKPRWYMSKKCEICFKTYADSKCLKKHIQAVHSKLKPYVCHVCGHSSARKAMWKSHVRQHTGEKPYKCTKCIFKTGDHNSLRRHMMRHSGVRPYQCPHCSYKSIQSSCYKNHISSRHPGKEGIFACKECSFTTVSQDSFVQHLLDHKNNLIACTKTAERSTEVEVFPENIAAAQLVYQCLGAVPTRLQSDVTASSTSSDGTKQTITIEIPPREIQSTDDEDTTHCFLLSEEYDTGGITIPAETESSMVCF